MKYVIAYVITLSIIINSNATYMEKVIIAFIPIAIWFMIDMSKDIKNIKEKV